MANITALQVKELRQMTGVGMMECKKALVETDGDIDAAVKILRERGQALAVKKAGREANQGLVAATVSDDQKTGSVVVVNCETDFVAKNDTFGAFVSELATQGLGTDDGALADAAKEDLTVKVSEIGENLVISDNRRYVVEGTGAVATYIHLGAQVGVMMELGLGDDATASSDAYQQLAKDLCMHVAATNPAGIRREDVDPDVVAAEKAIYAKQMEGKPPEMIEKIVEGKMDKWYAERTLLEQNCVKDPDQKIEDIVKGAISKLGENVQIVRFSRFVLGETSGS